MTNKRQHYKITVTVTHTERFGVEANSENHAKSKAARLVNEDIGHGKIPVEAFETDVEVVDNNTSNK